MIKDTCICWTRWQHSAHQNARNFVYKSVSEYTEQYYDATFDLHKIDESVVHHRAFWWEMVLHILCSHLIFFSDGQHLAVSAEIRKEVGESFDAIKVFLRQYEIVYMVWDERDLIQLRTNYRKILSWCILSKSSLRISQNSFYLWWKELKTFRKTRMV